MSAAFTDIFYAVGQNMKSLKLVLPQILFQASNQKPAKKQQNINFERREPEVQTHFWVLALVPAALYCHL